MVHWPEVMVSYESSEKVLSLQTAWPVWCSGQVDENADWASEARRYYLNIVGKYGPQAAGSAEKGRRAGYRHHLPPARPRADRRSEQVPELL